MYAVRGRNGKVVARFAKASEAVAFVRSAKSPRRSALDPALAAAFQAFDDAVRTRPPEGGMAPDGSIIPNPVWQAEALRMYDAFRKTAVRAVKLLPKIAVDDETALAQFKRVREGLYNQHQSFFSEAPGGAALAIISSLSAASQAAQEAGVQARQAGRTQELTNIRQREADRLANMTSDQRALWNYQQDLKLTRGR